MGCQITIKSIHLSILSLQEFIPGDSELRGDRVLTYHTGRSHPHTHSHTIDSTSLDWGRKPENPAETPEARISNPQLQRCKANVLNSKTSTTREQEQNQKKQREVFNYSKILIQYLNIQYCTICLRGYKLLPPDPPLCCISMLYVCINMWTHLTKSSMSSLFNVTELGVALIQLNSFA